MQVAAQFHSKYKYFISPLNKHKLSLSSVRVLCSFVLQGLTDLPKDGGHAGGCDGGRAGEDGVQILGSRLGIEYLNICLSVSEQTGLHEEDAGSGVSRQSAAILYGVVYVYLQ